MSMSCQGPGMLKTPRVLGARVRCGGWCVGTCGNLPTSDEGARYLNRHHAPHHGGAGHGGAGHGAFQHTEGPRLSSGGFDRFPAGQEPLRRAECRAALVGLPDPGPGPAQVPSPSVYSWRPRLHILLPDTRFCTSPDPRSCTSTRPTHMYENFRISKLVLNIPTLFQSMSVSMSMYTYMYA